MNILDIKAKIQSMVNNLQAPFVDFKYKAGYNAGVTAACDGLLEDIGDCFLIDGKMKPGQTVFWIDYISNKYIEQEIGIVEGTIKSIEISIRCDKQNVQYYCIRNDRNFPIRDRLTAGVFLYTKIEDAETALQRHIENKKLLSDMYP